MSWFTVHVPSEATGSDFSVVELRAPAGDRSPLHRHTREDEVFVVLEGRLRVWLDGRPSELGPGEARTGPRGVPRATALVAAERAEPTGHGLGGHGTVSTDFEPDLDDDTWAELSDLVLASYCMVAPRTLARLSLEAVSEPDA